jgi:hypothetical protein
VLKLVRTIADLVDAEQTGPAHMAQVIQYLACVDSEG